MVHDVIQKADKALYTANLNGKNKVCSAAEQLSFHTIMNLMEYECLRTDANIPG
jgi:hypothetical protein